MTPRIAAERSDSGELRINKICELIRDSQYGVHDISRMRTKKAGDFCRQNMPFEFGMDYAARRFGEEQLKQKHQLILCEKPFEYQKAFSDISGMDIKFHNNEAYNIVCEVRNWCYETVSIKNADDFIIIWFRYADFLAYLDITLEQKGISKKEAIETLKVMPIIEYIDRASEWINKNI